MGSTPAAGVPAGMSLEEYARRLNARANRGDPDALAELRALFAGRPPVWRAVADAALAAAAGWANLLADGQAAVAECITLWAAEWKAGLAGPGPTPLVEAAADAAVVARLAVCYAQKALPAAPPARRAALDRLAAAGPRLFGGTAG